MRDTASRQVKRSDGVRYPSARGHTRRRAARQFV